MTARFPRLIRAARLIAAATILGCLACGVGVRPYREMAQAATSEENVMAQVGDKRLTVQLREALLANGVGIGVTPHVYMDRAYLVGFVTSDAERTNALAAAQSVAGIRSVDSYLPTKAAGVGTVSRTTTDVSLEAEVKAAIGIDRDERLTRVTVAVLDGHVVLLGVVASPESAAAVQQTAQGVPD